MAPQGDSRSIWFFAGENRFQTSSFVHEASVLFAGIDDSVENCSRSRELGDLLPITVHYWAERINRVETISCHHTRRNFKPLQGGELSMLTRSARLEDAPAIARIYNQGIEDRIATFETEFRTAQDVEKWFDGIHPIVVAEEDGDVLGYAATFPYSSRPCYAGIAEFSVYVAREARRRGVGRLAMKHLIQAAEQAGFWKLLSRVFPENIASLRLLTELGFREVGVYRAHGQLDGVWRDVVIVEYLLHGNIR
jgi:phosphinothricin acetyltransferase